MQTNRKCKYFSLAILYFVAFCLLQAGSHSTLYAQAKGGQMQPTDENSEGTIRALIVGVSKYKKLDISNQLDFAVNDAKFFYDYLLSKPKYISPENIFVFFDEQATNKQEIERVFTTLLRESKKGDWVIFFFTGHGDIQNLDGDEDGFLLLHNVDKPSVQDYYFSDAIEISQIQKRTERATKQGVKVLLIFDACHSGKAIGTTGNTKKVLGSLVEEWENSFKIVSSQPNELSYEDSKWGGGHGVFTWYLINGIKGLADEDQSGEIDLYEVSNYVKQRVREATLKAQTPASSGSENQVLFKVYDSLKKEALADVTNNKRGGSTATLAQNISNTKGLGTANYFFNLPPEDKFNVNKFIELLNRGAILPQYQEAKSEKPQVEKIVIKGSQVNPGHSGNAYCIGFNNTGTVVATGGEDGKIFLWDSKTLNRLGELDHRGVLSTVFSNDDKLLISGGWNEEIRIWDLTNFSLIKSFQAAHKDDIRCLAIDPSGNYLASSGDDLTIKIWDLKTKMEVAALGSKHTQRVTSLEFGNNSNTIYSVGKDGLLIKWSINNAQVEKQVNVGRAVNAIKISRNRNTLAIGCEDGYMGIYGAANIDKIKDIAIGLSNINSISADSDANYFIVGGKNRALKIYDFTENKIIYESELPRGITTIDFSYYGEAIGASLFGGQWVKLNLDIPSKEISNNALEIFEHLLAKPQLSHIHPRLKGYFVSTILSKTYEIIDLFLNDSPSLPSLKDIEICKAEITKAKEFVDNDDLLISRINTYTLLLDIFESSASGNFGKLQQGIAIIEALIKELPDASFTYNLMATFYQKLRKLEEAKKAISVASKNIPDWVEPKLSLSYTYFLERQYDSASFINTKVINSAPLLAKAYMQQANLQSFLGDFDNAKSNYQKAVNIDSLNPGYLCDYAKLYLRVGDLEGAKKMIDRAISTDSKYYQSYFLLAEISHFEYINSNDKSSKNGNKLVEQAFDYYHKSLLLNPTNADIKARIGNFYLTLAKNSGALQINIRNRLNENQIGRSSTKINNFAVLRTAQRYFSEALKADPYLFYAYYGLLTSEMLLKDKKGAKKVLDDLTKMAKNNPQANHYIARYYIDIGKAKKAVKPLKSAIAVDNSNLMFYLKLMDVEGIKNNAEAKRFISSNYTYRNVELFTQYNPIPFQFFYY
jgi:WD40 repeat protein/Tfp pilus assembly protein PilF